MYAILRMAKIKNRQKINEEELHNTLDLLSDLTVARSEAIYTLDNYKIKHNKLNMLSSLTQCLTYSKIEKGLNELINNIAHDMDFLINHLKSIDGYHVEIIEEVSDKDKSIILSFDIRKVA